MRQLVIKPRAQQPILEVADWLAQEYFPDTGDKYIDQIESFLWGYCHLQSVVFPPCKRQRLAKRKLSCIVFKKAS